MKPTRILLGALALILSASVCYSKWRVKDGAEYPTLTAPMANMWLSVHDDTGGGAGVTRNLEVTDLLGRSRHTGTQPLSSLSQSGAISGQVPTWNGAAWVPGTMTSLTYANLATDTLLQPNYLYNGGNFTTGRTFDDIPSGSNGDQIKLLFIATTTVSFNFHTNNADIVRAGSTGTLSGAVSFPAGNHWITFQRSGSQWAMWDTGTGGVGGSGGTGGSLASVDLAGGTTLAVNTAYFDTISATRTLAALPAGTNGDQITLTFDVTGATQSVNFHTNSTVYRIGENGALSAALSFPVGNHKISLEKKDGKWFILDSASVGAEIQPFSASDEITAITTGAGKFSWRAPFALTLTGVRASLTTASSSGIPTFDINESGVSVLSTKITIDATEKTSVTAAVPAVISDAAIADDAEITVDVDTAGTGATGVKFTLYYTR